MAIGGHDVRIWAYEPDVAQSINESHENTRFLAGVRLAADLVATNDQTMALESAELVVYATPSNHLRSIARSAATCIQPGAIVTVASKGIELGTMALMTDVIAAEVPHHAVVALSGSGRATRTLTSHAPEKSVKNFSPARLRSSRAASAPIAAA